MNVAFHLNNANIFFVFYNQVLAVIRDGYQSRYAAKRRGMIVKKVRLKTVLVLGLCTILSSTPHLVRADEVPETEIVSAETETEPETEEVFEKVKVMFVLDTLRVHEGPSMESKTIAYCDLGSSVSVLGQFGEWYHVRLDDPYTESETEASEDSTMQTELNETESAPAKEGYIVAKLLSEDRDEAERVINANEVQKQMNAAAAAAAAASSGGVSVVSTRRIPNCLGTGGTVITTYSDGSTSTSSY